MLEMLGPQETHNSQMQLWDRISPEKWQYVQIWRFRAVKDHWKPQYATKRAPDVEYGVAGFGICSTAVDSASAKQGLIEK